METQNEDESLERAIARCWERLPPEKFFAGLTLEQRMAGLTPEETLLCLPDELLRGSPESFVATLSVSIRERIPQRIAQSSSFVLG